VKTALTPVLLGIALAGPALLHCGREVVDLALGEGDSRAIDSRLSLHLERFEVKRYPSGSPRQFVSTVRICDMRMESPSEAQISVNHPLRRNGWWIYQFGYGPDEANPCWTQLRCVRDPMLPLATAGGALVMLGAFLLCWRRWGEYAEAARQPASRCRTAITWIAALSVVVLPVIIIGRVVMRPEPMPALQSVLMAPHVAAYAASYLLLLFAAFGIGRRLVPLGFLLMTLGLVIGAVWGKFAWGEWWQFDPKENWSFLTWLVFAVCLQFPATSRPAGWLLRLGAALIVITLTWVNFSRFTAGRHSYADSGIHQKIQGQQRKL